MEFSKQPTQILDKAATLAILDSPTLYKSADAFSIKSQYLCDYLNELEKEGYVYNAPAQRRFEQDHGVGPYKENGTPLSLLIYNAQGFRHNDKLRAEGWEVGSEEMMKEALTRKLKIQAYGCGELLTVREKNGRLYTFKPRKSAHALMIDGKPCKLVKPTK